MTRAIITDRIEQADDGEQLLLVLDQPDTVGEEAVGRLGERGYEGDDLLYVVATDGWIEHRLDGDLLIADVVAYPDAGAESGASPEVSRLDPAAHRLLRVTSRVDPTRYARLGAAVAVWFAEPGSTDDEVVAAINAVEEWPLIFAAGPATDDQARPGGPL